MVSTSLVSVQDTEHNSVVLELLPLLYQAETYCDVTFHCQDGVKLKAHRLLLASVSPFLRDLFDQGSHDINILLPEVFSSDLDNMLRFLYEGLVRIESTETEKFKGLKELLGINIPLTTQAEESAREILNEVTGVLESSRKENCVHSTGQKPKKRKFPFNDCISRKLQRTDNSSLPEINPSGTESHIISSLNNIIENMSLKSSANRSKGEKGEGPLIVPLQHFKAVVHHVERDKILKNMDKLIESAVAQRFKSEQENIEKNVLKKCKLRFAKHAKRALIQESSKNPLTIQNQVSKPSTDLVKITTSAEHPPVGSATLSKRGPVFVGNKPTTEKKSSVSGTQPSALIQDSPKNPLTIQNQASKPSTDLVKITTSAKHPLVGSSTLSKGSPILVGSRTTTEVKSSVAGTQPRALIQESPKNPLTIQNQASKPSTDLVKITTSAKHPLVGSSTLSKGSPILVVSRTTTEVKSSVAGTQPRALIQESPKNPLTIQNQVSKPSTDLVKITTSAKHPPVGSSSLSKGSPVFVGTQASTEVKSSVAGTQPRALIQESPKNPPTIKNQVSKPSTDLAKIITSAKHPPVVSATLSKGSPVFVVSKTTMEVKSTVAVNQPCPSSVAESHRHIPKFVLQGSAVKGKAYSRSGAVISDKHPSKVLAPTDTNNSVGGGGQGMNQLRSLSTPSKSAVSVNNSVVFGQPGCTSSTMKQHPVTAIVTLPAVSHTHDVPRNLMRVQDPRDIPKKGRVQHQVPKILNHHRLTGIGQLGAPPLVQSKESHVPVMTTESGGDLATHFNNPQTSTPTNQLAARSGLSTTQTNPNSGPKVLLLGKAIDGVPGIMQLSTTSPQSTTNSSTTAVPSLLFPIPGHQLRFVSSFLPSSNVNQSQHQ